MRNSARGGGNEITLAILSGDTSAVQSTPDESLRVLDTTTESTHPAGAASAFLKTVLSVTSSTPLDVVIIDLDSDFVSVPRPMLNDLDRSLFAIHGSCSERVGDDTLWRQQRLKVFRWIRDERDIR